MVLVLVILMVWFTFVIIGIIKISVSRSFVKKQYIILKFVSFDKIDLLIAAVLFGGLIGFLSIDKFYKFNFCLMNPNDKMCNFNDLSCFKNPNMPIQAVDYGFGNFLKTDTKGPEKGIGYYSFTFFFKLILYRNKP